MILELPQLLSAAEVEELREIAARAQFMDGRLSNPGYDQKVNLQIDPTRDDFVRSARVVTGAFERSFEFREYTQAKRIAPPMLAKYEPGMKYGPHADAAFLPGTDGPLRSDLSCTVFLSEPDAYEGGELVLHFGDRAIPIKLSAGGAILYPSTTLHEVAPVRRGIRLVAITFIESRIANEQDRWIVFELSDISSLEGERMSSPNRIRLEVIRQNLARRWSSN